MAMARATASSLPRVAAYVDQVVPPDCVHGEYEVRLEPHRLEHLRSKHRWQPRRDGEFGDDDDEYENNMKWLNQFYESIRARLYEIKNDQVIHDGMICVLQVTERVKYWFRAIVLNRNAICATLINAYAFDVDKLFHTSYDKLFFMHRQFLTEDWPLPRFIVALKNMQDVNSAPSPDLDPNLFGQVKELPEDVVGPRFRFKDARLPPIVNGCLNDFVVDVCFCGTPDNFAVNFKEPTDVAAKASRLEEAMSKFYRKYGDEYKVPMEWITTNFACAAPMSENSWARVVVKHKIDAWFAAVHFVDSGKDDHVWMKDLRLLHLNFAQCEKLAVFAKIHNLLPNDDVKGWRDGVGMAMLKMLRLECREFSPIMFVIDVDDNQRLDCFLLNEESSKFKFVRERLILEGWAKSKNADELPERSFGCVKAKDLWNT